MLWSRSKSQFEIQSQEITFRQWSVRIERKAFRRTMTISLKPGAPITVKTSIQTPIQKIEQFLLQKEKWIEKHMLEFAKHALRYPEKKLIQSETFPFLGESLKLRFVPTPLKQVFFSRYGDFLQMHLPESGWQDFSEDDLQQYFPMLGRFYQREAQNLIQERIQIWSEQMQLFPKALKFRNQKSRWGSCTSRGSIQINWRLIGAPIEVIDYILIHELAHLKYMNHSAEFWELVIRHCPQYQTSEVWLKKNHALLDFLLKK
jgi:predicted metal-dependent hydrolase